MVADICEQLHFRKGYRIFKTSFERKNLSFVVRKTDNKLKEICHILSAVPGSAVIYSRTRKGVEEYAGKLRAAGISAEYFHAGLDPVLKTERQADWVKGFTRVLVATNAFGMGIDKGDTGLRCRFVGTAGHNGYKKASFQCFPDNRIYQTGL